MSQSDSVGTKKNAKLAIYMIEGIEQGRFLAVDELDSDFLFKLVKVIVAVFKNEFNVNVQLIFPFMK